MTVRDNGIILPETDLAVGTASVDCSQRPFRRISDVARSTTSPSTGVIATPCRSVLELARRRARSRSVSVMAGSWEEPASGTTRTESRARTQEDRATPPGADDAQGCPSDLETCMTTISLVTGASRGLGRNTAISVARRGGDVILTSRSGKDNAAAVVAEIEALGRRAVALPLDTGDLSSFRRSWTRCARRCRRRGVAIRPTTWPTMPAMARKPTSPPRPRRSSTGCSTCT